MEGVIYRTEGMEIGDLGVVADEVELVAGCEEIGIGRDGDTNGGDEVFALATPVPATSCSEFRSTWIEIMMTSKSEFETELDYRTAHSKVHWSELSPEGASGGEAQPGVDHRQQFKKLQKDVYWGRFCNRVQDVVLGRKLAEGAQADIYEAQIFFKSPEDASLWAHCNERLGRYDLRSLIDLRMLHRKGKGPPFSHSQAIRSMRDIVLDMVELHKRGIIHRDLKASNVLVTHHHKSDDLVSSNHYNLLLAWVADFECSVGVVGTGYWRTPEILQQLKNRTPCSKLVFSEKADVYSFAMTCYEIVTGLIPFEGLPQGSTLRDAVLNGSRPELPHDLDLRVRAMITSCWDPNPSLRPSFVELVAKLKKISKLLGIFRF